MNRRSLALLVPVACLLITSISFAEPPKNGVHWQTDLLKAREMALKADKPLLVVFGAEWCTFCKKMERSTLSEKAMVQKINAEFIPVHLDFDRTRPIAKALKVKGIPSSIVLSTDADVLSRKDGFAKSKEYNLVLSKGLSAHKILRTAGRQKSSQQ
jgi:thioredoxin-related protein